MKTGAGNARVDDTNRLKTAIANWLNSERQQPQPLLKPMDKLQRGFHHDVTGRLLCPVDYDWLDLSYASSIY